MLVAVGDRGHRAQGDVGHVGGLAIRRDRNALGGVYPVGIGGPEVLVAAAIGVTVSEPRLATYAVTGLADPAREADESAIEAASAAACGAGTIEPSPVAIMISNAGMPRQRSTAPRAAKVPAAMAYRPLIVTPMTLHDATTLSSYPLLIVKKGQGRVLR